MKLRLKPTVLPFFLYEEVALQFNSHYYRIPDPKGHVRSLINALDGTRRLDDVLVAVTESLDARDEQLVRSSADDLITHALVESIEDNQPMTLTAHDQARFSRNIDFFGSMTGTTENKYRYQEKICNSKVCVLGCGGLGTHILFDLVALGVHNLTIVDFDRIEISNLNRQILYREADIGAEKVHTAKARLLEFNSNLNIQPHSTRLESAADIERIIAGHDIVICVADKPANYVSEWLNTACVKQAIPFVTGGLDTRRAVVYSVIPGKTGCVQCWLSAARSKNPLFEQISISSKRDDITYSSPAPAFVTLVAVTAGMMVSEAVKILTGCQRPQLTDKLKEFTFDELSTSVAEIWEKQTDCEVCSRL